MKTVLSLTTLALLAAGPASASGNAASEPPSACARSIVFPAKEQSAQQQATDEAACHDWAVLQVGFDPARNPPPAPPSSSAVAPAAAAASPAPGSGARGAVRGAATGAVIGEVAGGDAGEGALAGAAVGAARARRQSRARQQAQAASQAQASAQADAAARQEYEKALADWRSRDADYCRARAACLEGKGYVVK